MNARMTHFMLSLISMAIFTALAWGDEATLQRFVSEAPRAWGNVDTIYDSKAFTVENSDGKAEVVQLGVERKASGYEVKAGDPIAGSNYWFIANRDYRAIIGSNNQEYFMGSVKAFKGERPCMDFESNTHCRPSYCFFGSCVFDCIVGMDGFHNNPSKKAFVATDATVTTGTLGEEWVIVSLLPAAISETGRFEVPEMPSQLQELKVSLTLIPSRNWCVKAFVKRVEYTSPNGTQVSSEECSFEFSGESCHPSSKVEDLRSTETNVKQKVSTAFSELSPANVSEEEFRLTAFALPEPAMLLSEPNRMLYMIAGCAGFVGIAFLSYRKLR